MARDILVDLGDTALERGETLHADVAHARLYGKDGAPIIVVLGGISATRFVADGGRNNRGWWSTLVRNGGPIDLSQFQVLGLEFAPTSDCLKYPDTITTGDQARRLKAVLDHQGIDKIAAIIGSSYGGMTALCFADMTTYRTPVEFADRFSLRETGTHPATFDICDYLESRGDAFAETMDAQRFLALSESIDLHRVEPENISTPTLLMTAISDQIAPLPDMQELRDRLGGPSELYTFTSLFGHDAFLKEYDAMGPKLTTFCEGLR